MGQATDSLSSPKCYTGEELSEATAGWRKEYVIGKGGFGTVYKGWLASERKLVAIKRPLHSSPGCIGRLWNELSTAQKHPNLVSVLGYCDDPAALVCEYMAGGDLSSLLRNPHLTSSLSLWHRAHLLYQAACGLEFLHHRCTPPIRHCDLTPQNILLDGSYNCAKVADFGLSRAIRDDKSMSSTSTNLHGTFGYLCPIYLHTRSYTRASDVYSFGVIAMHLIIGEANRDKAIKALDNQDELISKVGKDMPGEFAGGAIRELLDLAASCITLQVDQRPPFGCADEHHGPAPVTIVGRLRSVLQQYVILSDIAKQLSWCAGLNARLNVELEQAKQEMAALQNTSQEVITDKSKRIDELDKWLREEQMQRAHLLKKAADEMEQVRADNNRLREELAEKKQMLLQLTRRVTPREILRQRTQRVEGEVKQQQLWTT